MGDISKNSEQDMHNYANNNKINSKSYKNGKQVLKNILLYRICTTMRILKRIQNNGNQFLKRRLYCMEGWPDDEGNRTHDLHNQALPHREEANLAKRKFFES